MIPIQALGIYSSCTMHVLTANPLDNPERYVPLDKTGQRGGWRVNGKWVKDKLRLPAFFLPVPSGFQSATESWRKNKPSGSDPQGRIPCYGVHMHSLEGLAAGWEGLSARPQGHCWLRVLKHCSFSLKLKCTFPPLLRTQETKLCSHFSHLSPLGREERDLR